MHSSDDPLYLDPNTPGATGLTQDQRLLLIPSKGLTGTLFRVANRCRTAQSLDIPYPKMHQLSLYMTISEAISIGHTVPPGDQWVIYKGWLQYFRSIVLKVPATKIATILNVHYSTYRRWELHSKYLPPPQWTDLLWKWWTINLDHNVNNGAPVVLWEEATTIAERRSLTINRDPRYWHKRELHRLSTLYKGDSNDSD